MRFDPAITDSVELRFSKLARAKNLAGQPIISFGLGEPDFPTPPTIIAAAEAAMRAGFTRYSDPLGLADLRQRIVEKLRADNGIAASTDQILVAPGAKMALSLALGALLAPGDEVVAIAPCYPSYVPQVKIAEPEAVVKLVPVRTDTFAIDLSALATAIGPRTRAVLVNSPHNPTGHMMGSNEVEGLADLLATSGAWLLSDEVYEKLAFSGRAHISPAARSELTARTITINGFSKAYAMTGWRIGYLHVPDPAIMHKVSQLQQHLNTNTAPFIQKAALAALELPSDHLSAYNRRLAANARALSDVVAGLQALSLVAPDGGLFAFLDIRGTAMSSDAFATGLLEEEGVAATPGSVFGAGFDGFVRVSLAIAEDRFAEGARRLEKFTRQRIS